MNIKNSFGLFFIILFVSACAGKQFNPDDPWACVAAGEPNEFLTKVGGATGYYAAVGPWAEAKSQLSNVITQALENEGVKEAVWEAAREDLQLAIEAFSLEDAMLGNYDAAERAAWEKYKKASDMASAAKVLANTLRITKETGLTYVWDAGAAIDDYYALHARVLGGEKLRCDDFERAATIVERKHEELVDYLRKAMEDLRIALVEYNQQQRQIAQN